MVRILGNSQERVKIADLGDVIYYRQQKDYTDQDFNDSKDLQREIRKGRIAVLERFQTNSSVQTTIQEPVTIRHQEVSTGTNIEDLKNAVLDALKQHPQDIKQAIADALKEKEAPKSDLDLKKTVQDIFQEQTLDPLEIRKMIQDTLSQYQMDSTSVVRDLLRTIVPVLGDRKSVV